MSVFLSQKLKLRVCGDHSVIHNKALWQQEDIWKQSLQPWAYLLCLSSLNRECWPTRNSAKCVTWSQTKHLAILSVILAELKAGGRDRSELFMNCE